MCKRHLNFFGIKCALQLALFWKKREGERESFITKTFAYTCTEIHTIARSYQQLKRERNCVPFAVVIL